MRICREAIQFYSNLLKVFSGGLFVFGVGMMLASAVTVLSSTSRASVTDSYLFGKNADEAFGSAALSHSARYVAQARIVLKHGYRPLSQTFGADTPSSLRILIKDDSVATPLTQEYVDTISREKASLMAIYGLSNEDYNRLAAIAFGILGRETKFGRSFKYKFKEHTQSLIAGYKDLRQDVRNWIHGTDRSAPLNSRGLTQIKDVPEKIERYYCADENGLNDPRVTAVATMGFLAESLRILKNRVRNKQLTYVTSENLFDYVLYVYFGSMRKLVNPYIDYKTGRQIRDIATPELNLYVRTVKGYMRSLAFFENRELGLPMRTNSACRSPFDH